MAAREFETMLSPGEAAARLGVTVKTLARWARERRLPFIVTPGGHRRFRETEVDRLRQLDPDE
jgi:excisionase family DNA binding protein